MYPPLAFLCVVFAVFLAAFACLCSLDDDGFDIWRLLFFIEIIGSSPIMTSVKADNDIDKAL